MKLFRAIGQYSSLVKFSHTVFAMPFALIGFLLGLRQLDSGLDGWLLLQVILCMVFARSAAMAFNRYADHRIDKKNPRTESREIPSGKISPARALVFICLSAACFVATCWFINLICFVLSPVALIIILGYSYTKRFTFLSHYVLGLGLALAPIGAYLATTGNFGILPLLYSGLVFFWVAGFDIIYSIQDEGFDKEERLHSIPAKLGVLKALWISAISHFIAVVFLITAGILGAGGVFFWSGAAIFTGLLIFQHWQVTPEKTANINRVFALTNGLGGVALAIFYIADYVASV